VLASVAFDAGIIQEPLYTMLIMLALITQVIAGSWLEAVLKRGRTWSAKTCSPTSPLSRGRVAAPGGARLPELPG
jgi:hypothetical protein